MKHLDIHVTGRVQGVFFRVSTQRKANELGVRGIVRNELDGSVYIEAEADEPTLTRFVDWCRRGLAHADVRRVDAVESAPRDYAEFSITD